MTGPYWVLALVQVDGGALRYQRGLVPVAPPGQRFAVFMPPGSIVRVTLRACAASTEAMASGTPPFDGAPRRPVVWRWSGGEVPATLAGIARAVRGAGATREVSAELRTTRLARRTKALLDHSFARPITLARLAAEAGGSPSGMSRAFRRAYGLPPVEYRHRLRIIDAMFRLASGAEILSVVEDVGFADASRLYRHFRSLLCEAPGSYAALRSRNAKT